MEKPDPQTAGALGGAVIGAVTGGPIGLVVGAGLGWLGGRVYDKAKTKPEEPPKTQP